MCFPAGIPLTPLTVAGDLEAVPGGPAPRLCTSNGPLLCPPAGFPRRREPALLYGVCEWRLLPGTAPQRRVNAPPPPAQGLRYPQAL